NAPQDSLAMTVSTRVVWDVKTFVISTLGAARADKAGTGRHVKHVLLVTTTKVNPVTPPPVTVSRVAQGVVTRVTDSLDTVHVGQDGNRHFVIRDCQETCAPGCDGPCHVITGNCSCGSQWRQLDCTVCSPGHYSPNLGCKACGAGCEDMTSCDTLSGSCSCRTGWEPPTCHASGQEGDSNTGAIVGSVVGVGLFLVHVDHDNQHGLKNSTKTISPPLK
ncbi:hypothetical protein BaRGS_00019019, partial [Batillaria attramentaria]